MKSHLIGREAELSVLNGLLDEQHESQLLVITGEPGLGKTVLLDYAAGYARAAGQRVLSAVGRASEQDLAFAGLQQLLQSVVDRLQALPERQANALRGALALTADPVSPDTLLTGLATQTLLSGLSEDSPLLLVVDDAQWLDHASLGTLAFAARRLQAEQVAFVLSVRGTTPPPRLRDFPLAVLRPLNDPDAGRLLDEQPHPPHGAAREQVVAQASGNPLALIELSKVVAADPDAARRWASEPLPLNERLTAVMTAQFRALPAPARSALLLAAVADSADPVALNIPALTADTLGPAEASGLITVSAAGSQFIHPLARAAVYHAVPFAERAAAHRHVAEALDGRPDRRAWHLAAATLQPDEGVAALLEETAGHAQRRGGVAAAARALERAAELSPDRNDQAGRLLAAAEFALLAGQANWVQKIAGRVLLATEDKRQRLEARLYAAWALTWSNQQALALGALTVLAVQIQAAERTAADTPAYQPNTGWAALGLAGTVAYQTGGPASRDAVLDALHKLEPPARPAGENPVGHTGEIRLWVQAAADPFGDRTETIPSLHRLASGIITDQSTLGAAAWLLDETSLATRLLRDAITAISAAGLRGRIGGAMSALQWAYIDSGQWDEALAVAREARDTAAAYKMEAIEAAAYLALATVLAVQGEHSAAAAALDRARAVIDWEEYRAFSARSWHAAGLSALAEGDYTRAYSQLTQLLDADGRPLHHHVSYLGLADLAAAAARAGRQSEVRTRVEAALALVEVESAPRLGQLAARARGLLAEPAAAGALFAAGLSDLAGDAWPFERAQLQLDYGGWLRRHRRAMQARPLLLASLETFRRLRARAWAQRAEIELRACGGTVPAAAAPAALDRLTAQEREVVVLASRGLTNAEIADRLFMAPRTVSSHLYRSYSKLGVGGRQQLGALIDRTAARLNASENNSSGYGVT